MPVSIIKAKVEKVDEFYTFLSEREDKLEHYSSFFGNKVVYCCCDNLIHSNFHKYFRDNKERLEIKKIIATCKGTLDNPNALLAANDVDDLDKVSDLLENGDFESGECMSFFKQADIIVTNPPFSKAKTLLKLLISLDKKLIIVANRNLTISKDIFPLFKSRKIRYGVGFKKNTAIFLIPPSLLGRYSKDVTRNFDNVVRFRNILWVSS